MKKLTPFLALIALLAFSLSALSATTGSLLIKGVVPAILSVVVNAEAAASNLNLATGHNDLKVAVVTESSNSGTGYKITVSSLNQGKLKRSGGTQTVNYTLKYNNTSVNLSNPTVARTVSGGGIHLNNSEVKVSLNGSAADSMVAGSYEDTLTFEIAAN